VGADSSKTDQRRRTRTRHFRSRRTPPAAYPSGRSPAATTSTAAWSARHSPIPPGRRPANGEPSQHPLSAPSRCPGQTRRPAPHRLGDLDHRGRPARLRRLTRGDQGLHPKPPSCRAARTAQRSDHDERPGPATTPGLTPHTEPGPRTPFTAAMAPRQRRGKESRGTARHPIAVNVRRNGDCPASLSR
jgi:hypothetical protein